MKNWKMNQKLFLVNRKNGKNIRDEKIGRNDMCPCGSGEKYKICCSNKK